MLKKSKGLMGKSLGALTSRKEKLERITTFLRLAGVSRKKLRK